MTSAYARPGHTSTSRKARENVSSTLGDRAGPKVLKSRRRFPAMDTTITAAHLENFEHTFTYMVTADIPRILRHDGEDGLFDKVLFRSGT